MTSMFDDDDDRRAPILSWADKERFFCMASTPGGRVITAGDTNGDITFWDSRTGSREYDLTGHTESVLALAVVTEMNALFSAGADSTVRLWNLETLQNIMVFEGHRGFVVGLHAMVSDSGTGLFSGSDDRTVKQWNSNSGACVHTYKGHKGPVNAIVATEAYCFSGSSDGVIKVWDLSSRKCVRTVNAHSDSVWSLCILYDGRVVSGSTDSTVRVWENLVDSSTIAAEFAGHAGKVRKLISFGPTLFSGGADSTIRVWDTKNNILVTTLKYHTKQISGLTLENNQLCSCSFDKNICRWDVQDLLPIKQTIHKFRPLSVSKQQDDAASQRQNELNFLRNKRKVQQKEAEEIAAFYKELPVNFVVDALEFKVTSSRLTIEVLFYIPFLICFVFVFMLARPIQENFYMVSGIESVITNQQLPSFKNPRTFSDITSSAWFYRFLNLTLEELWRDRAQDAFPSVRGQNILLGALRVRQKRASNRSCTLNQARFQLNSSLIPPLNEIPCYGTLSASTEQVEPYLCPPTSTCTGVDPAALRALNLSSDGFVYRGDVGTSFQGQITSYQSGGYAVDFNFSEPIAIQAEKLAAMKSLGFLDDVATRLVDVSFYLYNPSIDLFVGFQAISEVPIGGCWLQVTREVGFEVYTSSYYGRSAFQIFFFFFVLVFVLIFIKSGYEEFRKGRLLGFFLNLWNIMELANLTIFIVMYGYLWTWVNLGQQADLSTILLQSKFSDDLQKILILYETMIWYNAVNTILTFLKLLKYVRLNDRLNILTRTLAVAQQSLIGVLVLFVYIVFGFCITGNHLYGIGIYRFRSLAASYISLLRQLIGDIVYDEMSQENRIGTIVFSWSFQILCLFILLNFLVAVISDGFREVSEASSNIPLDMSINKVFNDARYEFLPATLKQKLVLLRHLQTQTGVVAGILEELLRRRKGMVDTAAAERNDYDELDDVMMHLDDIASLVPEESQTLVNQSFIDEVWKDMTWEYHHKKMAAKGQSELEREAVIHEEVEQALRQLTAAFPAMDTMRKRLEVQEARLKPIARTLGIRLQQ